MKLFLSLGLFLFFWSACLQAQEYVPGKIITYNKDTLSCKILKHKSRKLETQTSYQSIQVLTESGDTTTLDAAQIAAYIKDKQLFRSLRLDTTKSQPINIFIKQLVSGRAELYYHPGNEKNKLAKYFFKKRDAKELIVWDGVVISHVEEVEEPVEKRIEISKYNPQLLNFKKISNEEAVREYFIDYFADCLLIVNKLKTQFYNGSELKLMFTEYSSTCK